MSSATALRPVPPPNTLVLQSATTMRFALFGMALLATGLFVGVSLFGALHGAEFTAAARACLGPEAEGLPVTLDEALGASDCLVPLELSWAGYALGGVLVVALGALLVVVLAPAAIIRRRSLRPLGPALLPAGRRVLAFCSEAGVRRPPRLVVGTYRQRDAFCLGFPGRYVIVLPPALAVRPDSPQFAATFRHEVAHVRHHDVAFARLAQSAWYVVAPLLLVPVGLFLATGDGAIVAGYLWRAVVLAVVIEVAARAALRSREHSADIAAAVPIGAAAFEATLARTVRPPVSGPRRLLARHPATAARIAAVREPGAMAAVSPADAAVVAFLVALVLPTLDLLFTGLFVEGGQDVGPLASALLLGPLAAATLGVGLWRQALLGRVAAVPVRMARVSGAVAAAAVAGQFASLAAVGLGADAGYDDPAVVLVIAGALTGATLLTAGVGEIAAQAPPRRGGRAGYVAAAVVVSTLVYVAALWVGDVLQGILDLAGWADATVSLFEEVATPPVATMAVLLAAAVAVLLRQRAGAYPRWLVAPPRPVPPPPIRPRHATAAALAAGLTGAVAITAYHAGLADTDEGLELIQRSHAYAGMAAAAGAAAALILAIVGGRCGRGAGLLAGPVATAVAALATPAVQSAFLGRLPVATIVDTLTADVALGWVLTVAVAVVPLTYAVVRPPSLTVLVPTAVLVTALAAAATALGRDTVLPPVLALFVSTPLVTEERST